MSQLNRKGLFLALEGGEGAGKSTQRHFIAKFFEDHGRQVMITREPGGTPYAERIREVLLTSDLVDIEKLHAESEMLLFFAARNQHLTTLIRPALDAGKVVITDRFIGSTYALQLAHGNLNKQDIDAVRDIIVKDTLPDYTFLFDVDPVIGLERRKGSGYMSRIDAKDLSYHQRVRENYLRLAEEEKGWIIIDANQNEEQVQGQLLGHLIHIFNSTIVRPTMA